MLRLYKHQPVLVVSVIVCNILLTLWCIHQDPVINNDGVTYLAISQMLVDGNWKSAFNYYSWPFYSLFVAGISKLFLLELETAALVLNTISVTFLCLAFISIVSELSNKNRRIILIAAAIVIFLPSISKYRSFITRDFAYLACYLWSLYFVIRYCNTRHLTNLIGWLIFALLSSLFRFEGVIFLIITPYLLLLFDTQENHYRRATAISTLIVLPVFLALLWWYADDKYGASITLAQLNGENINSLWDLFLSNMLAEQGIKSQASATYLDYAQLIASNTWVVFYELIRRMSIFYFFLSIFAYVANIALVNGLIRRMWLGYLAINISILWVFGLFNNFFVSRYTMASVLTLLLLSPFALNYLYEKTLNSRPIAKSTIILFFTVLISLSAERLLNQTNKTHLKSAGLWLATNTEPTARIHSNNRIINYYAKRNPSEIVKTPHSFDQLAANVRSDHMHATDYIAYEANMESPKHRQLKQTITNKFGRPIKVFREKGQRRVFIFAPIRGKLKHSKLH